MFRRRGRQTQGPESEPATESNGGLTGDTEPAEVASGRPPRPNGPWDVSELDGSHPSHGVPRLDLGGLRIRPLAGMQVQMQVDQASGRATSVLLADGPAALQLMAIAAAKSTPLWPSTMAGITADAARKQGSTQEGNGPWGPVLRLALPATTPDGKTGVQPSVVLGIDGPRWMLRATMIGKAAVDQETMNRMMGVVKDSVVVRGEHPMPPGELIALTPPPRPEPVTAEPSASQEGGSVPATAPDRAVGEAAADETSAGSGPAGTSPRSEPDRTET